MVITLSIFQVEIVPKLRASCNITMSRGVCTYFFSERTHTVLCHRRFAMYNVHIDRYVVLGRSLLPKFYMYNFFFLAAQPWLNDSEYDRTEKRWGIMSIECFNYSWCMYTNYEVFVKYGNYVWIFDTWCTLHVYYCTWYIIQIEWWGEKQRNEIYFACDGIFI